jgi:hypothetical protein
MRKRIKFLDLSASHQQLANSIYNIHKRKPRIDIRLRIKQLKQNRTGNTLHVNLCIINAIYIRCKTILAFFLWCH